MVLEPNFTLGIKQTSLISKRRFSRAHHHQKSQMLVCWIQISQHLVAAMAHCCVQIHKLKQSHDLTFQICAHQAFACRNRHHKRAPRTPVRKTQKSSHPKPCHMPQLSLENLPRAALDS